MYYLRYEDRDLVQPEPGSLNPATESNLFWRLPFPDEDNARPGTYDPYNRGMRLYKMVKHHGYGEASEAFTDPSTVEDPGRIQLRHESGYLLSVPCYHGEKLPETTGDIRIAWNGRSWFYELAFVKNTENGVLPVVRCRHCGNMWRYSWDEILPYLQGKIKERLAKHQL